MAVHKQKCLQQITTGLIFFLLKVKFTIHEAGEQCENYYIRLSCLFGSDLHAY